MKRVNIALEHEEFLTFQQRIVSLSSHPAVDDDSHRHTQVHGMEILNRPKLGIEFSNTEEFYAFSASHGRSRELDAFTIRLGLERVQAAGIQTTNDAEPVPLFFVNVHLSTLFSDYWQKVMANLPVSRARAVGT